MAFIPLAALPLIAAGTSAIGVGAQALATHNAAEFQAKLSEMQARQQQDQASVKASEVARDTKQRTASLRAGTLQNGFEISGSPLDLLKQTERQGELDYLTAVYDGSVTATGLRATAKNYKRQASNALVQGAIGMGSAALGGVADVYKMRGNSISVAGT